ncbi:DUF4249 domain-containing protein [Hymenobacter lutimineralis]|uniref:DUF4249 domain-containing protein n=1 Tax=Hymenobacter lutimineralis TaxID=2606448 RepID=A0A5D6VC21_9BACT|nr:DUF4249 domain-containing protein [Hymenobacter lutimineralis]TYZ13551.1 DUF4249 domain-containing protein [Hymenobacter lutimineralis]
MMGFNSRVWKLLAGVLLLVLGGCVDKFEPDVLNSPQSYLVVDGFINLNGPTTIRLSRTKNKADAPVPVEADATVTIQDEAGAAYPLPEQEAGTYQSAAMSLNPALRYRLRIRTAAGKEYASDLVAARQTPPIDKVTWALTNRGLQVYVSTHDDANATRYYRWRYDETWLFHSAYPSGVEYVDGVMQNRQENIYYCWGNESSTAIQLGSTSRLSQDVVKDFPLRLLESTSVKLGIKYSILVKQYALTAEEFAYWEKLKKNTESLGGLFDPQPTQLTGNVHNQADAAEPVIGYVGAATYTEKRLFIDRTELESIVRFQTGYESCGKPDTVKLADVAFYFSNPNLLPLEGLYAGRTLIGYTSSPGVCVDCRLRGTNVKPDFWP